MVRLALGGAERVGLRSPDDSSLSRVSDDGACGAGVGLADLGAAGVIAAATGPGVLSVAAGDGCAGAPGASTRGATEARPNMRPAAAAATIVQRERTGRCDAGPLA